MVVACPTGWIDSRRTEEKVPNHNSVTPIDELVPSGVTVALGTDNIADIYKPFDGDMWTELRILRPKSFGHLCRVIVSLESFLVSQ